MHGQQPRIRDAEQDVGLRECSLDKVLEGLNDMFGGIYQNKHVLLTGHTGFKGSWLCAWLTKLGAKVCGVSLLPETDPNHFDLLKTGCESHICDIRNHDALKKIVDDFQPEFIFHLAAQPLVRLSYQYPIETFETNVIGTANVLECCRTCASVKAVVVITTDKCYDNNESGKPFRETDPMGGYDPYSASKGCAELVVSSFRNSFFPVDKFGTAHNVLVASARAGNVIGGGDWAADRLIPDLMKATAAGEEAQIRNPHAVRPWQHVLEPLSGYLALGQKLLAGNTEFASAWNFGPLDEMSVPVGAVAKALASVWNKMNLRIAVQKNAPHEAGLLRLDCTKAAEKLHWHGVWDTEETFRHTAEWYKAYYESNVIRTEEDFRDYFAAAEKEGLEWTK